MAITITPVYTSYLRVRFQLDADDVGFGDSITLAAIIALLPPNHGLAEKLQQISDLGLPATDIAAASNLFADGTLNSSIVQASAPGAGAKIAVSPLWAITVIAHASGAEFFPSLDSLDLAGIGGRAYWDLYEIHTVLA